MVWCCSRSQKHSFRCLTDSTHQPPPNTLPRRTPGPRPRTITKYFWPSLIVHGTTGSCGHSIRFPCAHVASCACLPLACATTRPEITLTAAEQRFADLVCGARSSTTRTWLARSCSPRPCKARRLAPAVQVCRVLRTVHTTDLSRRVSTLLCDTSAAVQQGIQY